MLEVAAREAGQLAESPDVEMGLRAAIADAFRAVGRYDDALEQFRLALAINAQVEDRNAAAFDDLVLQTQIEVTRGWQNDLGGIDELRSAIEKNRGKPELDRERIYAQTSLSWLLSRAGRPGEALEVAAEAHASAAEKLPRYDDIRIGTAQNYGMMLAVGGQRERARGILEDVLAGYRELYPKGHGFVATALQNLADLDFDDGDFATAESGYRAAVQMFRRSAERTPRLADALHKLGRALVKQEDLEAAEPAFSEALRIYAACQGGERDPTYFQILDDIAYVWLEDERFDEANDAWRRVAEHLREKEGADSCQALRVAAQLVRFYEGTGREDEAQPYRDLASRKSTAASQPAR